MRTLKTLVAAFTFGALVLVLTSCGGGGTSPFSFTLLVPTGMTAYATLQGSDGSVITSKAVDSGTKEVSFADAAADSLVTVSMQGPYQNANNEMDYLNLTVPTSTVAGKQVYLVYPVDNPVTVNVSFACGTTGTPDHIRWWSSGYESGTATCAGGTFTINTYSTELQSDGSISMVLIGYDASNNPIDYAVLLDRNINSGALTINNTAWAGSAPSTAGATFSFPSIQTTDSAYANFQIGVTRKGQPFDIMPSLSGSTSTVTDTSLAMSGGAVPVGGATYNAQEGYTRTYSDPSGFGWDSMTQRQHQLASIPTNEPIDTSSDLWPVLANPHWVDNGGSPTLSYTANAGASAATFALASITTNDGSGATDIYKTWIIAGVPNAFGGTIQFPDMPSSLSTFVPTPLAMGPSTFNDAAMLFTDFDVPLFLLGLGPVPFFGNAGVPSSYHLLQAETNHVTTSSIGSTHRPARPYLGIR